MVIHAEAIERRMVGVEKKEKTRRRLLSYRKTEHGRLQRHEGSLC